MAVASAGGGGYAARPSPSGLADVIDIILDKGLVIDAYVRVSLIGIEILTIDARIVIASVDTYLRFAEAVNRLDLTEAEGVAATIAASRTGTRCLKRMRNPRSERSCKGAILTVGDRRHIAVVIVTQTVDRNRMVRFLGVVSLIVERREAKST